MLLLISVMLSAWFCSVYPKEVIISASPPPFIHDRLHGYAGSFCPEQNHTAKLNCMLSVYHFDHSGPDRNVFSVYKIYIYIYIKKKKKHNDANIMQVSSWLKHTEL